jgi:sugar-specific transcriptional regulator TrmB
MNHLLATLSRLGISDHAARLYVHLLERGHKTATELVTGLDLYRPQVYRALAELHELHLITQSPQAKQKTYTAESPKKLERLAHDFAEQISELIPELESRAVKNVERPIVKTLAGASGIRAVFDDVIDSSPREGVFYRYTSELDLEKVNKILSKDYRVRRDAKKLERFVISNHLSGDQKKKRLERSIKFIGTTDPFNQNIIELIYANKVAIIDLNTEISLIIENERITAFQRSIFKNLYRLLK